MNTLQRIKAKLFLLFSGKRGLWRSMALGVVVLAAMAVPAAVRAGECGLGSPHSCIAMIFVWIFQILTSLMGFILIMEVDALIRVAQYFNFVSPGPTAVQVGWVVTRDLANMFFIVFLMIIAFSTVIGYSKYHYEQTLKKLLIMAVVINFSKTIVGLMIDVSQVVMLSFVNGFRAAAAGNFMNAFQINKLLRLADGVSDYNFGLVLAMMLAFILAAIAVCVVLVMLVMLVFRVIMLWVLIILSPIAFLTAAFPLSGNYYAQWWAELKKYLVGGPVIAFFLWLALATAQATGGNLSSAQEGWGVQSTASSQEVQGQAARLELNRPQIPSEAGRTDTILSMVIVTCIMFAGLKFASDPAIGGMAAGFAGKVRSKAVSALRAGTVGVAGYGLKRAAEPLATGVGRGLARVPLVGGAGRYLALTGEKWKKDRIASREKTFGGPEDFARLSPGAFVRQMSSLSQKRKLDDVDKKRLDGMLSTGLKNPALAQSLTKSGQGHDTLDQLIQQSSGKGLQDIVGTAISDKNASSWMKGDPDLLKRTYDKLRSEWKDKDGNVLDPNMAKTVGEFEQKFAVPLHKNGLFSSIPSVADEKLKQLVPKMSSDDIGGIAKDDMGFFMKHMTSGQLKKVMSDGKPDQLAGVGEELNKMPQKDALAFMREKGFSATDIPTSWYSSKDENGKVQFSKNIADFVLASTAGNAEARAKVMADPGRADALRSAATRGLSGATALKDDNKIAAAAVQAMSVGALKVDDLKNDSKLLGVLGSSMDTAALARGINKDDAGQLSVAREAFKAVMAHDPTRVRNLSKNDLYNKLLPSKQEIDAAVAAQAAGVAQQKAGERVVQNKGLADEASELVANMDAQLKTLAREIGEDKLASRTTTAKEEQEERLTKALENLSQATQKRGDAENELARLTQRLTDARSSGADADSISGLESAIKGLESNMQELEAGLAKQVALSKGIKIDEGGGRKNRRGGGANV
ncbi:MAG: hypothetical protein QY323_05495 [Patescibacteria group bacterium]|nr:MAG: hypothetical protein QY323_05495 [Patescibacteria group bacterium]